MNRIPATAFISCTIRAIFGRFTLFTFCRKTTAISAFHNIQLREDSEKSNPNLVQIFKTDWQNQQNNVFYVLVDICFTDRKSLCLQVHKGQITQFEIYSSSEISHDSPLSSSQTGFGSLFSNISQYNKNQFKRFMNHLFRSMIHMPS